MAEDRADDSPDNKAEEMDPRFVKGLMTALKLFKPGEPVAPSFEYLSEIAQDWNLFSISTVMGDVWGREGLEPKQRAMITIAVLTALDKPEQLDAVDAAAEADSPEDGAS